MDAKFIQKAFDKCIILHGCPPDSKVVIPTSKRWMNWIAEELNQKGYTAVAPAMPTPWEPDYKKWKTVFEKYQPTANSILIGHSCGAAFLVRWLLESGLKVKKLILVAPAKIEESEIDPRKSLYDFELPEKPADIAESTIIFTSNDFDRHLKSLQMYKKALNARVIELENKGHFLIYTMGTNEFPELLEQVLTT